MKNKSSARSARRRHWFWLPLFSTRPRLLQRGFITLRTLLGLLLGLSGVPLSIFAGKEVAQRRPSEPERYMSVPGGDGRDESASLGQLEQYWRDRVTFPTGRFDPAWMRAAA